MTQRKKVEKQKSVGSKRLELKRKSLKDLDAKSERAPRGGWSLLGRRNQNKGLSGSWTSTT